MLSSFIERSWDKKTPLSKLVCTLLMPLSWLYGAVFGLRKLLYQSGVFQTYRTSVPLIVVGNLSVGGTGKTPLVIGLTKTLTNMGYSVGIITRGYGGTATQFPILVTANTTASVVGDEALLLAERTGCPVVVDPNRVAAADKLIQANESAPIDIIVSDDGLQHYRLGRDVEILVHDSQNEIVNPHLFPAGPWRQPPSDINNYDVVAFRGENYDLKLETPLPVRLNTQGWHQSTANRVHAVAGIGKPSRFFQQLREAGYEIIEHPFPDHHRYVRADLEFREKLPILMTEKDAVKCRDIEINELYYVPATAQLSEQFSNQLINVVQKLMENN